MESVFGKVNKQPSSYNPSYQEPSTVVPGTPPLALDPVNVQNNFKANANPVVQSYVQDNLTLAKPSTPIAIPKVGSPVVGSNVVSKSVIPPKPDPTRFGKYQGLNTAIAGLQALGGIYSAYQSNALAREAFNFNRDMSKKDYGLKIKDYNRRLAQSEGLNASNLGMTRDEYRSFQNSGQTVASDYRRGVADGSIEATTDNLAPTLNADGSTRTRDNNDVSPNKQPKSKENNGSKLPTKSKTQQIKQRKVNRKKPVKLKG
jgi:hypothetical protein